MRINGMEVLEDGQLEKHIGVLRQRLVLQRENSLEVEIHGQVGDIVTVAVKRRLDESACAPKVFFETPAADSIVNSSRILVTGMATGSRDIGITVNGFPAEIDLTPAGKPGDPFRWFADAPASPGAVTLRAIAINAAGAKGEASRNIFFSPPADTLVLRPSTASGVAPLSVTFDLSVAAPEKVARYEFDLDGDGLYEISGPSQPDVLRTIYATPGIHIATARIVNFSGVATTVSAPVIAQTFATMNALLQREWSRFTDALSAANVEAALAHFADAATKEKYRPALELIRPTMVRFATGIKDIQPISIEGNVAHYLLTRVENGQLHGYHVYFARDATGVWKVLQF